MDDTGRDDDADERPEAEALEELVGAALAALESAGREAVDELLRGHPDQADVVRLRLARLERLGLLDATPAADLPERVGEFAIEDLLAEGGMGVVYRARDESLGRAVALKVVRPELLLVPGARARIRREAEAAAQLSHPGVATLHRYGEHEGLPYLAMELVEGRSLAQVLEQVGGPSAPEPGGRELTPDGPSAWTAACLQVGAEVARALAHAHRRGVLHRDVKPSNVLIDRRGHARLVDFGLAHLEGGGQLTRTGSQVGSLSYMAPEQLAERSTDLDGRVDVYALGVTLYELLTRTSPFAGFPPEETIRRIREGHAARPRRVAPHLSRDVEAVLLQAMAVDRERRYPSAEALAEELDALLALRPVVARPPTATARLRTWMRRRQGLATAAVLLPLAGLVLWGVLAWQQDRSRRDLAEEGVRTAAQTAAMGELLVELGLILDEAVLDQDGSRMARIQARLDALEAQAAALPEAGTGDPLAVANGRLTLALRAVVRGEFERTAEHVAVARAALADLGDGAPLGLVFRAHALLGDLARELDDPDLRRASWAASRAAFTALGAAGELAPEDRLRFVYGAIDEAALARTGGDFGRAIDLCSLAQGELPGEPDTRAERLACARTWIETGRLSFDLLELEPAREAAARARDLLEGVVPDTTPVRAHLVALARLEAELLLAAGDAPAAAERLERAATHVDTEPETQLEFEVLLRFLDLRLRLAQASGDTRDVDPLLADVEAAAMDLLDRYGKFERARGIALHGLSNLVAMCLTPERQERGLDVGRRGEARWSAVAGSRESSLTHARLLLNLGALEQYAGELTAAAASFAEADRVLEVERRTGRDDRWLDRTQLAILANQGVVASLRDERETAERSLTRARDLARTLAATTGDPADRLQQAQVAQELANVHMDTAGNAHSIAVLEESIAGLDALAEVVGLSPALASERDWQCVSLLTQFLQTGGEVKAHGVLRAMLERPTDDPDLAAQLATLAAYAIRVGHAEAAGDRELCVAWVERAQARTASFVDTVEAGGEPWDRLTSDD